MTGGRVAALAVIWALAAGLMISGTLDVVHSALLAACATAAVLVRPGDRESGVPSLPPLPIHRHAGAHGDLAGLSWRVFNADGVVSDWAIVRVRALATGTPRLDALGRTIDSCARPSARQVIGWLDVIKQEQGAT